MVDIPKEIDIKKDLLLFEVQTLRDQRKTLSDLVTINSTPEGRRMLSNLKASRNVLRGTFKDIDPNNAVEVARAQERDSVLTSLIDDYLGADESIINLSDGIKKKEAKLAEINQAIQARAKKSGTGMFVSEDTKNKLEGKTKEGRT